VKGKVDEVVAHTDALPLLLNSIVLITAFMDARVELIDKVIGLGFLDLIVGLLDTSSHDPQLVESACDVLCQVCKREVKVESKKSKV